MKVEEDFIHIDSVQDHNSLILKKENTFTDFGCITENNDDTSGHFNVCITENNDDTCGHFNVCFSESSAQAGNIEESLLRRQFDNGHNRRIKYTDEQKHEMVQYGLEHGPAKTAQEFSIRLQMPVSESTVRVALKAYHLSQEGKGCPMPKVYHKPVTYNKYTFEQKNQIAQYAIQHGPSKTARDFSLKWGIRMGESFVRSTVRQFKKKLQQEQLSWTQNSSC